MKRIGWLNRAGNRGALKGAALLLALGLAACGSTPNDETAGMSTEKLYSEARDETNAGGYERAIKLYERLEGRAAGTLLGQQAQLERAYLLYRTNEQAQALAIVERFVKLHPTSPAFDYALYLQGIINFNDNLGILGKLAKVDLSERDQQASRDSYQSFKQLSELFPQSKYTPDAKQRMTYIVNALAEYEVHVARYYFRRGAYVAAVNRAQQAVQEFQYAPATEEALSIMVQAYERLGMKPLRDDAERVLRLNYPQSRFLKKAAENAS
jgi:outer membrane protein assembly factor BamD